MKDSFFIAGALSDIGRKLIEKAIKRKSAGCFILADLPSRQLELNMFAKKIAEEYPALELITIELDVYECKSMEQKIEDIYDKGYNIRYFVYLAGTNVIEPAISVDEDIWNTIMNVNLKGFFFLAQAVGRMMMQHNGGSIVSIASQHGTSPNYNRAVYCASKAGLIRISQALALEWAKYNIRVNTVSPTYLKTSHNEEQVATDAFAKKWLNSIPLHKCALPEDVASAVLFLLSEESSMITGHDLVVDGGWLIKHM